MVKLAQMQQSASMRSLSMSSQPIDADQFKKSLKDSSTIANLQDNMRLSQSAW